MLEELINVVDIANIFVAFISLIVFVQMAFRTKGEFDKSAKLFGVCSAILFMAALFRFNEYLGIFPTQYSELIFVLSRFLGMLFLMLGGVVFLRIISQREKK